MFADREGPGGQLLARCKILAFGRSASQVMVVVIDGHHHDDEEAYFDFDSIPNCSFDDCFLSREAVAASTIACCVVQVIAITVNIVTIITIVTVIINFNIHEIQYFTNILIIVQQDELEEDVVVRVLDCDSISQVGGSSHCHTDHWLIVSLITLIISLPY